MNTLFFHTIRYLRFEQIRYWAYYRFQRPWLSTIEKPQVRKWQQRWGSPTWKPASLFNTAKFCFLNETGLVNSPSDWNDAAKSKLWLYNLHYFDDLNAEDAEVRFDQHVVLINRWIAENLPMRGIGWEPYVISLRLVNWVKWCSRQEQKNVRSEWLLSLALQAQALTKKIEYHILGNHLLANGKALVFVGAFLESPQSEKWLKQGLKILDREIPEQFLFDGAHFELSPMYHAALVWDICDLINLANRSGLEELLSRCDYWKEIVSRGITWLAAMVHPDKEISFFNDAALNIAPRLIDIENYATKLGCFYKKTDNRTISFEHLEASGYCAVYLGEGHKAILDMARVGASYQPGHAHADTLSFELSLYGQRFVVNSGISQYGNDIERQRQRSTRAHNTVEVDYEDSSEVWAGFRVGRRAYPQNVSICQPPDQLVVNCSHNGYRRLPGRNIHHREWIFRKDQLVVRDLVTGDFDNAEAHFYIHPDISIHNIERGVFKAVLSRDKCVFIRIVGAAETFVMDTTWHPQFGVSVANKCIAVKFHTDEIVTYINW